MQDKQMQEKQSKKQFFIILPPDTKFEKLKLTSSELALLKSAITKIKENQLTKLMGDLVGVFQTFELAVDGDIEKVKKLLKLATLDSVKGEELIEIFKINLQAQEEDKQIKAALKTLGIEDTNNEIYKAVYRFRHVYYLDKLDKCMDNALAFPESVSERLLQCRKQTDYFASRFFRECSGLNNDELAILRKVYPDGLLSKKIQRREAHLEISLTLIEIHCLIAGGLKKIIDQNKIPEVFEYAKLSEQQTAVYTNYTNPYALAHIVANDLEQFLAKKHAVNGIDYHTGMTPLAYAVKLQKEKFVRHLTESGADVNLADNTGYSPLHYACEGDNETIFALLLSKKCNVNCVDRGKYTPLYIATEMGKPKYVKDLLEKEANPHLADNRYMTAPSHLAVRNSDFAMVKILLASNKVNKFLRNLANETIVDIALQKKISAEEAKEDKEVIQKKADILKLITDYINPPIDSMLRPSYAISLVVPRSNKEKMRANIAEMNLQLFSPPMNKSTTLMPTAKPILTPQPNALLTKKTPAPPPPHLLLGTQTKINMTPQNANMLTSAVKELLFKPKENKSKLEKILLDAPFMKLVPNPFPCQGTFHIQESSLVHCSYFNDALAENKENDFKSKFQSHVLALKNLREKGITYPEAYSGILKLIEKVRSDGLGLRAFAFEIYRHDFLDHLINLQEQKTDLQVAIEGEDITCINHILKEKPDRTPFTIDYKKEKITELNFAIQLGKVASVTKMLEMAHENSLINLGPIPDNAIELTEKNLKSILDTNPAFKEAEDFHGLKIPDASKRNYFKLLKQLFKTVPMDEHVDYRDIVNYLFTEAEYNVIRVLIGESESDIETVTPDDIIAIYRLSIGKEIGDDLSPNLNKQYPRQTLLRKQWVNQCLAQKYLGEELAKVQDKIDELDTEIILMDAFEGDDKEKFTTLTNDLKIYKGIKKGIETILGNKISYYQQRKYFREAFKYLPQKDNIFKHATDNIQDIQKNNKLTTPDSAIKLGYIYKTSTPEGGRKNIYWSQNSSKTSITPFRAAAKHVIELKIHQAIKENLLTQEEVYSTPHFSAFDVQQKIPNSYVFIGADESKKTIYSVHHFREKDEKNNKIINKKCHWYDYFENGRHISSFCDETTMDEEIFINDNIKATAYRFMLHLRRIKGPFTSGTYYHYILDNYLNVPVLESGIAAIFNVLNSEIKISKDLPIDHPAINIVANKKTQCFERLEPTQQAHLISLIEKANIDEFSKAIFNFNIYPEQLGLAILKAVELQNLDFVVYLLDLGVPISFENNKVLNLAIAMMEQVYDKNKGNIKQSTEFSNAFNVVYYLLYHGKADENDPQHIRQVVSADCFAPIPKGPWSDMTEADVEVLGKAILKFDDIQIQALFLNSVTKNLKRMLDMAQRYALLDVYKFIAHRLGIKKALQEPDILYTLVDNNELQRIEDIIRLSLVGKSEDYWLLAYAIRQGKVNIVKLIFPYFKEIDLKSDYSALHLAIRFNQFPVFKCLVDLGADINRVNILNQKPIDTALRYGCMEAVNLLTEKDPSISFEQRIIEAIQNKQIQLVKLFVEKIEVKLASISKNDLIEKYIKPLTEAISVGSLDIFNILFNKYKNHLQDSEIIKQFYYSLILTAAHSNKLDIFNVLLKELIDNNNKSAVSLFTTFDRWLFGNLIPIASAEILTSCIEMVKCHKSKLFTLMSHKRNRTEESYLDIALLSCDQTKVEVIRKYIPDLNLKASIVDQKNILVSILRKTNDVSYLQYLLEKLPAIFPTSMEDKILVLAYAIFYGRKDTIKWFFEKALISRDYRADKGPLIKLIQSCFDNYPLNAICPTAKFKDILLFVGNVIGLDTPKASFNVSGTSASTSELFKQFVNSLYLNASLTPVQKNTLQEIKLTHKDRDVEIIEKNALSNSTKPFNQPQFNSLSDFHERFFNNPKRKPDDEPPEQPLIKHRKKDHDQNRGSVNNNNK